MFRFDPIGSSKVEQLKKDFESKLAEQHSRIEALTSGLEKLNAQFAGSKPAPQVVQMVRSRDGTDSSD